MFAGTPAELAELAQKTRAILNEIAERLNRLDELAPGATWGEVGSLGGTVVRRGANWIVDERR